MDEKTSPEGGQADIVGEILEMLEEDPRPKARRAGARRARKDARPRTQGGADGKVPGGDPR